MKPIPLHLCSINPAIRIIFKSKIFVVHRMDFSPLNSENVVSSVGKAHTVFFFHFISIGLICLIFGLMSTLTFLKDFLTAKRLFSFLSLSIKLDKIYNIIYVYKYYLNYQFQILILYTSSHYIYAIGL